MRRHRHRHATLCPASRGTREQHKERCDVIREIEREAGCPTAVLLDLQRPKLRVAAPARTDRSC